MVSSLHSFGGPIEMDKMEQVREKRENVHVSVRTLT